GPRPRGGRTGPDRTGARPGRGLRRLLRVGQPRSVPPPQDAAAPFPGRLRGVHPLGQHVHRRRLRGPPPPRRRVGHGRGPSDAEWAAGIAGIEAGAIRTLARRMAATRTLVTVSFSLQRAEHGEQPVWAAIALAAALGQIGVPGGGFGHGYGAMADVGAPSLSV